MQTASNMSVCYLVTNGARLKALSLSRVAVLHKGHSPSRGGQGPTLVKRLLSLSEAEFPLRSPVHGEI